MNYFNYLSVLIIILININYCTSLECYVCTRQENNDEKCINTIKTCEQGEDVCLSEIEWGSTPYWSQGSIKQYYISKRCSSKAECHRIRKQNMMKTCTHVWYQDWKCSECCQGDRCNYYIISGSSFAHVSVITVVSTCLGVLVTYFFGRNLLF